MFEAGLTDLKQPPLFEQLVKEATVTARGAEFNANLSTFKQKYGPNADALYLITKELLERCSRVPS